jgi:DNA-binding MarR family transcriptional regulator
VVLGEALRHQHRVPELLVRDPGDGPRHPPPAGQLADHTGLEPLYVSKLGRALKDAGLIERTPDSADMRAVQLSLTERGQEVTGRAIIVVQQLMDQLLQPLGGLAGQRTQAFARELSVLLGPHQIPRRRSSHACLPHPQLPACLLIAV